LWYSISFRELFENWVRFLSFLNVLCLSAGNTGVFKWIPGQASGHPNLAVVNDANGDMNSMAGLRAILPYEPFGGLRVSVFSTFELLRNPAYEFM